MQLMKKNRIPVSGAAGSPSHCIYSAGVPLAISAGAVAAFGLLLASTSAWATEPAAADPPGINLQSILEEMLNYAAVARWPEHSFTCKQASSMDPHLKGPGQPGWFDKSADNFVRVEEVAGRKQCVMMDADGPGAIVRIFLTSNGPKPGKLRIYLDGSPTPVLEYRALDLQQGAFNPGPPLQANQPNHGVDGMIGNYSYLPIPYAKHCRVTWEESDGGLPVTCVCYQINYRTYTADTPVQTFSTEALAEAKGAIRRANRILINPPAHPGGTVLGLEKNLGPEESAPIDLPSGPAAVRELAVRLRVQDEKQLAQALRSTVVSAEFDGEQTVWCPLGDFFGAGPGLSVVQSWYRNVNADGQMVCRWTMPYAKSAKLTFHNLSKQQVSVQAEIATDHWKWDEQSMYFHTNWHFQPEIQSPPQSAKPGDYLDWNFITIKGKGMYVGDTLAIFNPLPSWYGEGIEKIWVDGDKLPSHLGTGTEDYYNFSWAPRPTFNGAFASHVRMDEARTLGHNVLTRTRSLDGITFQQLLQMDLEIHPWQSSKLDYAATTYWYALSGATSNVAPNPEGAARVVPNSSRP